MKNKSEKRFKEIQQKELLIDLNKGKVLKNSANGFVYLDKQGKQVKINIGKRRKGKDFGFNNPKYWVTLNWFQGLLVKLGFWKLVKDK